MAATCITIFSLGVRPVCQFHSLVMLPWWSHRNPPSWSHTAVIAELEEEISKNYILHIIKAFPHTWLETEFTREKFVKRSKSKQQRQIYDEFVSLIWVKLQKTQDPIFLILMGSSKSGTKLWREPESQKILYTCFHRLTVVVRGEPRSFIQTFSHIST